MLKQDRRRRERTTEKMVAASVMKRYQQLSAAHAAHAGARGGRHPEMPFRSRTPNSLHQGPRSAPSSESLAANKLRSSSAPKQRVGAKSKSALVEIERHKAQMREIFDKQHQSRSFQSLINTPRYEQGGSLPKPGNILASSSIRSLQTGQADVNLDKGTGWQFKSIKGD